MWLLWIFSISDTNLLTKVSLRSLYSIWVIPQVKCPGWIKWGWVWQVACPKIPWGILICGAFIPGGFSIVEFHLDCCLLTTCLNNLFRLLAAEIRQFFNFSFITSNRTLNLTSNNNLPMFIANLHNEVIFVSGIRVNPDAFCLFWVDF